ncbi:hypothetical protein ACFV3N_16705 [Streptomyces bauhiniae]|uniref:hypothetical protein n=1 Tax=Streptomyces bauhiniae TaxID=2340725 RepID=UPI003663668F
MSSKGTVLVHKPTGEEHRFAVLEVDFAHGALRVQARATMRADGSIEDGDVVAIYDPDRRLVTRYWLTLTGPGIDFLAGEEVALVLPISMGGPGGMAYADMTYDLGAELEREL